MLGDSSGHLYVPPFSSFLILKIDSYIISFTSSIY